jgi:hypothetical protein
MITLALSAMVGTSKFMAPYLSDLSHRNDPERLQQLTSHLLLQAGTPNNWGQSRTTVPTSFGLARAGSSIPYELDIDKVTRLNSANAYSLSYSALWEALGIKDIAFRIEVKTLFDLSIGLASNSTQANQTTYTFDVTTRKSGMPVQTNLTGYAIIGTYANKTSSSTSSSGAGTVSVSIPNSINGTALLIVFAKAKANSQLVSLNAYAFEHESTTPISNRTFTRLNPLDDVLNASFLYPTVAISKAQLFTFNYSFSLELKAQEAQTQEYSIPSLLDQSPMIIVLTGYNGSASFAEWVSYPQLPLQIGADFENSEGTTTTQNYVVTIDSAMYKAVVTLGGTV